MSRLDDLYSRYWTRLVRALRGFGERDAEDNAQEAFIATSAHLHEIEPEGEWAYLAQAGRRRALNTIRNANTEHRGGGKIDPIEEGVVVRDPRDSPEAVLIENEEVAEFRARFKAAFSSLDPVTQQCLILKRRDLDSKEIAAKLGMTAVAVRSRISRGSAVLRERVGPPPAGVAWLNAFGENDDHEK